MAHGPMGLSRSSTDSRAAELVARRKSSPCAVGGCRPSAGALRYENFQKSSAYGAYDDALNNMRGPMKDHATTEEILLTLKGLTKENMTGLIKAASVHMKNTRFSEPMDLVHEAMDLLLRGDRRWPKDIAFGPFMFATMRSIANSQRQRMEFRSHDSYEEMCDFGLGGIDFHPSAEEVAMSRERSSLLKILMLDAKRTLDADDANARIVLGAMMEDRTPAQICEATGMTISEYKDARQRTLRHARRLGKQKPL